MNQATTTSFHEPLALRPRAAAQALGISARTLHSWTKEGRVPHVRVGDGKRCCILYPTDQLRAWLAERAGGGEGQP